MASSVALPSSRVSRALRRPSAATVAMWALTVFVAFLVLYPLSMLFWGSIAAVPPGAPATPSLDGWVEAYSDGATYRAFGNTLVLSVIRTALSVSLAIFFAWVITRTDVPFKRLVELMLIAPFAAPTLLMTISWAMLASPKAGLLNQIWKDVFHVDQGPFNVYSYGGIVWVGVIQFVSLKVLLLVPAFRAMDATLEESSTMSGANRLKDVLSRHDAAHDACDTRRDDTQLHSLHGVV